MYTITQNISKDLIIILGLAIPEITIQQFTTNRTGSIKIFEFLGSEIVWINTHTPFTKMKGSIEFELVFSLSGYWQLL